MEWEAIDVQRYWHILGMNKMSDMLHKDRLK